MSDIQELREKVQNITGKINNIRDTEKKCFDAFNVSATFIIIQRALTERLARLDVELERANYRLLLAQVGEKVKEWIEFEERLETPYNGDKIYHALGAELQSILKEHGG
jgi:hypothetical protein